MISFLDGPAQGALLSCQRAPVFLRVVIDEGGKVDALDQFDDTPRETESIHVYRRDQEPGFAITCTRGKGGGCRREICAEYRLHDQQPTDEDARDTAKWQAWAQQQGEKEEEKRATDTHG